MVSYLMIGIAPAQKFFAYLLNAGADKLFAKDFAGKVRSNELSDGMKRAKLTEQITDCHEVRSHIATRFIAMLELALGRAQHFDPLALSPTPEGSVKNVCLPGDDPK